MDRNTAIFRPWNAEKQVALRKESVDRNHVAVHFDTLSAVALRKESVDRNLDTVQIVVVIVVALRKESVDRNGLGFCYHRNDVRRSPQGERG